MNTIQYRKFTESRKTFENGQYFLSRCTHVQNVNVSERAPSRLHLILPFGSFDESTSHGHICVFTSALIVHGYLRFDQSHGKTFGAWPTKHATKTLTSQID